MNVVDFAQICRLILTNSHTFYTVQVCKDLNVVHITTRRPIYPGVGADCCMKYNNCPAKPPGGGEMLHFIQAC